MTELATGLGDPRTTILSAASGAAVNSLALVSTIPFADASSIWMLLNERGTNVWRTVPHEARPDLANAGQIGQTKYATSTVLLISGNYYQRTSHGLWPQVTPLSVLEQPGPTVGDELAGTLYVDRRTDAALWQLDEAAWVEVGSGGGGGITLHDAKVGLSAGGADPITNLQVDVAVVNPSTGDTIASLNDPAGGALFLYPDGLGASPATADAIFGYNNGEFIVFTPGDDQKLVWVNGELSGYAADNSVRWYLNEDELSMSDGDPTFVERVTLKRDGSGLTLYDADGNARFEARETALRIRAAVDQTDPILELLDEDGNQRWIFDPDGELTVSVLDGINPAQEFFIDREDGFEMYSYNAGTKQASIQSSISSIGLAVGADLGMAPDVSIDMASGYGLFLNSGTDPTSFYGAAGLTAAARPAIPDQAVAVSVSDFNDLLTALRAIGITVAP